MAETSAGSQQQRRTHNDQNCLFFKKIPAELRNRIYEMVIGDENITSIEGANVLAHEDKAWDLCRAKSAEEAIGFRRTDNAIIQTCQQLRSETIQMFFAQKIFFITFDVIKALAPSWLSCLPIEGVETMTHVVLQCKRFRARFDLRSGDGELVQLIPACECSGCVEDRRYHDARFEALVQKSKEEVTKSRGEALRALVRRFGEFSGAYNYPGL